MRKEKMNNKGFSLVELIIVIAIMAILLVVLAPQYLKYVEKSRNSTDLQNAAEIVSALQIYAADPDAATAPTDGNIEIKNADQTPSGFTADALKDAGLVDGSGVLHTRCQSKTAWTAYKISWKVETNGSLTFTYSATGGNAPTTFSDRMLGATTAAPSTP